MKIDEPTDSGTPRAADEPFGPTDRTDDGFGRWPVALVIGLLVAAAVFRLILMVLNN